MQNFRLFSGYVLICALMLLTGACNVDNDLVAANPPVIEFDSPDGVYTVKVLHDVTVTPFVDNAPDADYVWTMGETVISRERVLVMNCPRLGSFYVMLTVSGTNGSTSAEVRIDVLESAPPVIDLPIPADGIYLLPGQEYPIAPRFQNADIGNFHVVWSINGENVSEGESYTFRQAATGTYKVSIEAENADGSDRMNFIVNVVDELPRSITFKPISASDPSTTRYTFAGRKAVITAETTNIPDDARFTWSVNGKIHQETSQVFCFTPDTPGNYTVSATAQGVTGSMTVVCVDATEQSRRRQASASSSPYINKVFEYIPAPGQFIGEVSANDGGTPPATLEQASEWAKKRMEQRQFVSLGACGGYIVAGFDHSVDASSIKADLAIWGNAFEDSNEPGTVWVMQDVNGNGLPDDEWYELRGSDYTNPLTIHNYSVTYYRPAGNGMDVEWHDNRGQRGFVNYISSYHSQASYYPSWITSDSYTLRGCRLPANGIYNSTTGMWNTAASAWGYADNYGSDLIDRGDLSDGGTGQCVGLLISNAVLANGEALKLQYIDFVMVQSAVMQQLGRLGEVSTEVFSIADYSMIAK